MLNRFAVGTIVMLGCVLALAVLPQIGRVGHPVKAMQAGLANFLTGTTQAQPAPQAETRRPVVARHTLDEYKP
jgi:hypothetical protein